MTLLCGEEASYFMIGDCSLGRLVQLINEIWMMR